LGAAETQRTNKVGAMIGARGCIYQIFQPVSAGVPAEYLVVQWHGRDLTALKLLL